MEEEEREEEGEEVAEEAEGEDEEARAQKEEKLGVSGKKKVIERGNGRHVRGYSTGRPSRMSPEMQGRRKYVQLSAAPDRSWGRWG